MIEKLFPEAEFSTAELYELAATFNKPVVKKYLRHLAVDSVRAICHGQRKDCESAESYLERQAVVSGGLATLEQLLAIEPPVALDGNQP